MTVKPNPDLTAPEKAALKAFRVAQKKAGMPPELREVAKELGVTSKRVEQLLQSLTGKGRLKKVARYRGYRMVRKAKAAA